MISRTKLHAVQERIAKSHGSQCGFCTPGIVMSMYTLLRNNPKPEMEDIETYFQVCNVLYMYITTHNINPKWYATKTLFIFYL